MKISQFLLLPVKCMLHTSMKMSQGWGYTGPWKTLLSENVSILDASSLIAQGTLCPAYTFTLGGYFCCSFQNCAYRKQFYFFVISNKDSAIHFWPQAWWVPGKDTWRQSENKCFTMVSYQCNQNTRHAFKHTLFFFASFITFGLAA